jgi:hypothetical protein
VAIDGRKQGPMTEADVEALIRSGRMTTAALVWCEGMAQWQAAGTIPRFATALGVSPATMAAGGGDGSLSTVIPYRNAPALTGYYVSIVALIPMVGLLAGPAAIVLGVLGLRARRRNPSVKGAAHAWVAIVLGTIVTLLHFAAIAVALVSAMR